MHKIPKYPFLLILLIFIFSSCNKRPKLWPANATKVLAVYYELAPADTAGILITDSVLSLPGLPDSAICKLDTITYSAPGKNAKIWFSNMHIQSVKKHSNQPNVTEYYMFDNGSVKLAGYTVNDTVTITAFSNPLVIIPAIQSKYDSTTTLKTDWNHTTYEYTGETNMQTKVKLLSTPVVQLNGYTDKGFLYSLTLSSDAIVGFGEHNLVVPGAIVMQSNLLFGETGGLICEWSIKNRPVPAQRDSIDLKPGNENYLEFIKYSILY